MSQTSNRPQPLAGAPTRRAYRSSDDAYLGGVAAGLAAHLGVAATWVRLFFLVTGPVGFGVLLYAGLWMVLPLDAPRGAASAIPGLESATRLGRRPGRTSRLRDTGPVVALAVLGLGVVGLLDVALGWPPLLWPVLFAFVGVAVIWRQADEAQRERWVDATGGPGAGRALLGSGGPAAWARLAAGAGMLTVALVLFAAQSGPVTEAGDVVLAAALGVLGLGVILGPWLVRLTADLSEERAARIRSQERADVAAHLHDSVLQTLALIQNNAGDATQVARLARAQERDLRAWMYGEPASLEQTVAASLRAAAAEVEDAHGVQVEVVTVGDSPLDPDGAALVAAAREAVVNAAKHSGVARVDVYAEAGPDAVEVFVRDRGVGFDPAAVPDDRLGLRRSIHERVERHGGTATVRSAPGGGTEVRLRLAARRTDRDAGPGTGKRSGRAANREVAT